MMLAPDRAWQIVKHACHALIKKRQPMFHACGWPSRRNGFIERILARDRAKKLAVTGAEPRDSLCTQLQLAARQQAILRNIFFCNLGEGVEASE